MPRTHTASTNYTKSKNEYELFTILQEPSKNNIKSKILEDSNDLNDILQEQVMIQKKQKLDGLDKFMTYLSKENKLTQSNSEKIIHKTQNRNGLDKFIGYLQKSQTNQSKKQVKKQQIKCGLDNFMQYLAKRDEQARAFENITTKSQHLKLKANGLNDFMKQLENFDRQHQSKAKKNIKQNGLNKFIQNQQDKNLSCQVKEKLTFNLLNRKSQIFHPNLRNIKSQSLLNLYKKDQNQNNRLIPYQAPSKEKTFQKYRYLINQKKFQQIIGVKKAKALRAKSASLRPKSSNCKKVSFLQNQNKLTEKQLDQNVTKSQTLYKQRKKRSNSAKKQKKNLINNPEIFQGSPGNQFISNWKAQSGVRFFDSLKIDPVLRIKG